MVKDSNFSQEDARWFYRFRENEELKSLVDSVDDFSYSIKELHDDEVREKDGAIIVFLRVQEDETDNYIARGVFDFDDESDEGDGRVLKQMRIEKSTVYGPLAGHGIRWFYEGGEIVEREWIS